MIFFIVIFFIVTPSTRFSSLMGGMQGRMASYLARGGYAAGEQGTGKTRLPETIYPTRQT